MPIIPAVGRRVTVRYLPAAADAGRTHHVVERQKLKSKRLPLRVYGVV
jgi:hypothetical protein